MSAVASDGYLRYYFQHAYAVSAARAYRHRMNFLRRTRTRLATMPLPLPQLLLLYRTWRGRVRALWNRYEEAPPYIAEGHEEEEAAA